MHRDSKRGKLSVYVSSSSDIGGGYKISRILCRKVL